MGQGRELNETFQIISRVTAPVTAHLSQSLCIQSQSVSLAQKRPLLVSCDLLHTHDTVFETDVTT